MGVCVLNYYGMAIYHYTGKVYQLCAGYKASHHTVCPIPESGLSCRSTISVHLGDPEPWESPWVHRAGQTRIVDPVCPAL